MRRTSWRVRIKAESELVLVLLRVAPGDNHANVLLAAQIKSADMVSI